MKLLRTYVDDDESVESIKLMNYKPIANNFSSPLNIKRILQNQQVYLSGFKTSIKTDNE